MYGLGPIMCAAGVDVCARLHERLHEVHAEEEEERSASISVPAYCCC